MLQGLNGHMKALSFFNKAAAMGFVFVDAKQK
jgi:hypothetical protein